METKTIVQLPKVSFLDRFRKIFINFLFGFILLTIPGVIYLFIENDTTYFVFSGLFITIHLPFTIYTMWLNRKYLLELKLSTNLYYEIKFLHYNNLIRLDIPEDKLNIKFFYNHRSGNENGLTIQILNGSNILLTIRELGDWTIQKMVEFLEKCFEQQNREFSDQELQHLFDAESVAEFSFVNIINGKQAKLDSDINKIATIKFKQRLIQKINNNIN